MRDTEAFLAECDARGAELRTVRPRQPFRTTTPTRSDAALPRPGTLERDVIGRDPIAGRWITWADATDEERELYVRFGSIDAGPELLS